MARGKGNPRCEKCEGRGVIRVPRGYAVCTCVRKPASRKLLAELAALPIEDFATADDAWRKERGLPPYVGPSTDD